MSRKARPAVPREEIIKVNNSKTIDFSQPYKFIYTEWWYDLLVAVPFFIAYVVTIFLSLKYRLKVIGRENLRILRRQGCITISNHCHYYDTVFANFVVLPRALHTAVAQRNYEVPVIRRILRIYRAFPIPAQRRGLDMIVEPVGEALRRKHHIHFLPEGDLVLMSQRIYRFHLGAFVLSYRHQAPIVPMVYVLKPRVGSGRAKFNKPFTFTLVIGEPMMPPPPRRGEGLPKAELDEMAEKVAAWMESTIRRYHPEMPADEK